MDQVVYMITLIFRSLKAAIWTLNIKHAANLGLFFFHSKSAEQAVEEKETTSSVEAEASDEEGQEPMPPMERGDNFADRLQDHLLSFAVSDFFSFWHTN